MTMFDKKIDPTLPLYEMLTRAPVTQEKSWVNVDGWTPSYNEVVQTQLPFESTQAEFKKPSRPEFVKDTRFLKKRN